MAYDERAWIETNQQTKAITARIQRVEMARGLAEGGKVAEALELFRKVREAYASEPDMQRQVDRLIERYESHR
jgi:hypothetical protein